jgi:hypothetical protein
LRLFVTVPALAFLDTLSGRVFEEIADVAVEQSAQLFNGLNVYTSRPFVVEQRNRVSVQPRVPCDIRDLDTALPIIRDKWHLIISPLSSSIRRSSERDNAALSQRSGV